MSKTKIYISLSVLAVIVLAGGSGFWLLRGDNKSVSRQDSSGVQGASSDQPLTQSTDPNSISLTETKNTPKSSGGLSVAPSSSVNNLGQLGPGSNNPSGGNTTRPSASAPNPVDPANFAQYDKYKEGTSALFGEIGVGNGAELTAGKKAAVYYKGWLTDGRLFDMSRPGSDGKLQPFVFEMGAKQVIPGWEQGLLGMKVGGSRLVIVPPAAGYGAAGQDPIPPNSVLVFQVQLLEVQ